MASGDIRATSLYLKPNGNKAGLLMSEVPTDGTGDFTFSRAGKKHKINSDLKLEIINNDVPDLSYDTLGGCPFLRTEKQATNLIVDPISFGKASWTKSGITPTGGYSAPSVDFPTGAFKLVANAPLSYIKLTTPIVITSGADYNNSIWVKRANGTGNILIKDINNIDNIISVDSTWKRFDVGTASTSTGGQIGIKIETSGDEVYVFMAQQETGLVATSPAFTDTTLATEGATSTRLADSVTPLAVTPTPTGAIVSNNFVQNYTTQTPSKLIISAAVTNKLAKFDNVLTAQEISNMGALEAVFIVPITGVNTFSITISGIGTVYWGDGTNSVYSGTDVVLNHTYAKQAEAVAFVGTLTKFYINTTNSNANFDLASLPVNLTYYRNYGQNQTSGDIAGLPVNLTYYRNYGQNQTSGDIAGLPVNLTYYDNRGQNQVNQYTAGHVFNANISLFLNHPATGYGLTATMVDNLLIDLDSSGMSTGSIYLDGNNASRTSASDAAVLSLQGKGVTVYN